MKAINLIPRALLTKRLWLSRLEVVGITILITGLASGGVWLLLQQQATDAVRQAERIESSSIVPIKQPLSSADSADTLLRVTTLNTLASTELDWPRAMSDVGSLVPTGIRLSTFSYAVAASKLTLQMGGQSKTASTFASFATTLQNDTRFSSIHVDSYTYMPTTGSVTFSITAVRDSSQLMYHLSK